MEDLRVEYLKIVGTQPIASTAVAASIFSYMSMIGLALEKNNCSVFELRLWLVGVLVHSILNLIIKIYQLRINSNGTNAPREDVRRLTQCGETLEIIGYVWFVLGNILFLENLNSRKESPFIFFLCVIYFSASYTSWAVYHIVQLSLLVYPPSSPEARRYWLENRYIYARTDRDDEFLADLEFTYQAQNDPAEIHNNSSGGLTMKQVKFWNAWLQSYGCYDIPHSVILDAAERSNTEMATERDIVSRLVAIENEKDEAPGLDAALHHMEASCTDSYQPLELDTVSMESVHTPLQHGRAHQADSELCAICLNALLPGQAEETPQPLTPSASQCDTPHSEDGLLDFAFNSASAASSPRGDVRTANAANNGTCAVIVRYPCTGAHYFHAHCLHSWMQMASTWQYNILCGREMTVFATCPCCRQAPTHSKHD